MTKYKATGIITCYHRSIEAEKDGIYISSDLKYEDKNLWIEWDEKKDIKDSKVVESGIILSSLLYDGKIVINKRFRKELRSIAQKKSKATFYIEYDTDKIECDTDKKAAKLYAVELTNEK